MKLDLSIIVVNWNTCDLLRECLESIRLNWHTISYEIIVVDNASNDGSQELVEREFPSVKLIKNKQNIGFVKANNQGSYIATGCYLLLLNNDTRVIDSTVDNVLSYLDRHPEVGIATGKVLNLDKSFQRPIRRFPHPVGAFFRHTTRLIIGFDTPFHRRYLMSDLDENLPAEVDWVSGAYLFLRREIIHEDRVFDQDLFMYYEDTLLCYKARRKGYKVMYLPWAPIIHITGATARKNRAESIFKSYQSSVTYFRKTRGPHIAEVFKRLVHTAWLLIWTILSMLSIIPNRKIKKTALLFRELFSRRHETNEGSPYHY